MDRQLIVLPHESQAPPSCAASRTFSFGVFFVPGRPAAVMLTRSISLAPGLVATKPRFGLPGFPSSTHFQSAANCSLWTIKGSRSSCQQHAWQAVAKARWRR